MLITTQPQQESTFLQDLQTGLDKFQADSKLQADLMLDGTRLFVGDALTAPGTALWIGWLGDKDLADLPLRGKAEEAVRISVTDALALNENIDWAMIQDTPRWLINEPAGEILGLALAESIRNRITGHKPSPTEICEILGSLTHHTDRNGVQDFNSLVRVARNLLANLSHAELKEVLRQLFDGRDGYRQTTLHSTVTIVRVLALLQVMQLPGPAQLFSGSEEVWAAEQMQSRFRSNFGLYAPDDIASSDIKAWVQQSRVAPWLHDLEERCIAHGRKFRVWSAPRGSIQDKIQTRALG